MPASVSKIGHIVLKVEDLVLVARPLATQLRPDRGRAMAGGL